MLHVEYVHTGVEVSTSTCSIVIILTPFHLRVIVNNCEFSRIIYLYFHPATNNYNQQVTKRF